MKLVCKKTSAKDFDLKEVMSLLSNEYDYGLILEKEYVVMGIVIYKDSNCLYYLIDEDGWPNWYPYLLFEVSDNSLPQDWYISVYNKSSIGDLYCLAGFNELCNDQDYHDLLAERDKKALEIYFLRKNEIYPI